MIFHKEVELCSFHSEANHHILGDWLKKFNQPQCKSLVLGMFQSLVIVYPQQIPKRFKGAQFHIWNSSMELLHHAQFTLHRLCTEIWQGAVKKYQIEGLRLIFYFSFIASSNTNCVCHKSICILNSTLILL